VANGLNDRFLCTARSSWRAAPRDVVGAVALLSATTSAVPRGGWPGKLMDARKGGRLQRSPSIVAHEPVLRYFFDLHLFMMLSWWLATVRSPDESGNLFVARPWLTRCRIRTCDLRSAASFLEGRPGVRGILLTIPCMMPLPVVRLARTDWVRMAATCPLSSFERYPVSQQSGLEHTLGVTSQKAPSGVWGDLP